MADVRSMLKASREARRINHPHASYTSDGKLLCNLCETLIKTEAAWQGHLHSTQHTVRQTRAQEAADIRGANGSSKKRKASTVDSPSPENRKKLKPTMIAPGVDVEEQDAEQGLAVKDKKVNGKAKVEKNEDKAADAAELEAFERELAEMEASMPASSKVHADATISAPAMTAEEVAAQAREEQSTQRGKRDAELEAEKEDAARVLEDEFEEMEGLEERVKKLREKREALRKAREEETGNDMSAPVETLPNGKPAEDEDDDEDDGDEDFDEWNFGAS